MVVNVSAQGLGLRVGIPFDPSGQGNEAPDPSTLSFQTDMSPLNPEAQTLHLP